MFTNTVTLNCVNNNNNDDSNNKAHVERFAFMKPRKAFILKDPREVVAMASFVGGGGPSGGNTNNNNNKLTTKKGTAAEDAKPEDDEGFLEGVHGGSPGRNLGLESTIPVIGSPSAPTVARGGEGGEVKINGATDQLFIDGGRRIAKNPWNKRTLLATFGQPLSRPYDDPLNEVDPEIRGVIMKLDEQAEKTREVLKVLSDATGMPIVQENGQRRFGPPPGETTIPPRGSEVFVGKIPRDAMEPELVPVFSKAGRIYELRLMMDFSGTNRGYCFVQYYTPEEAERAVMFLNHYEIRKGRPIGVSKSVDNCRLFIGGIPEDKKEEEILHEIKLITDGVVKVIVYSNQKDRNLNRGYAFVEYESHKAAAMARRKMIPGNIQLFGCDVAVDWAEPETEKRRYYRRNRQNQHPSDRSMIRSPKQTKFQVTAIPLQPIPIAGAFLNYPPAPLNYNFNQFGPSLNFPPQAQAINFNFDPLGPAGPRMNYPPQRANFSYNQPGPRMNFPYSNEVGRGPRMNFPNFSDFGPRMNYPNITDVGPRMNIPNMNDVGSRVSFASINDDALRMSFASINDDGPRMSFPNISDVGPRMNFESADSIFSQLGPRMSSPPNLNFNNTERVNRMDYSQPANTNSDEFSFSQVSPRMISPFPFPF